MKNPKTLSDFLLRDRQCPVCLDDLNFIYFAGSKSYLISIQNNVVWFDLWLKRGGNNASVDLWLKQGGNNASVDLESGKILSGHKVINYEPVHQLRAQCITQHHHYIEAAELQHNDIHNYTEWRQYFRPILWLNREISIYPYNISSTVGLTAVYHETKKYGFEIEIDIDQPDAFKIIKEKIKLFEMMS